jgi:hypothetical protein
MSDNENEDEIEDKNGTPTHYRCKECKGLMIDVTVPDDQKNTITLWCNRCKQGRCVWKNPRFQKFQDDMVKAGFNVRPYHGRFFYHGPAVETGGRSGDNPELDDVIRATKVKVQWDELGLGQIVYPR